MSADSTIDDYERRREASDENLWTKTGVVPTLACFETIPANDWFAGLDPTCCCIIVHKWSLLDDPFAGMAPIERGQRNPSPPNPILLNSGQPFKGSN